VGFDNQTTLGLSGAQAALPIWTEFMQQATAGTPVSNFSQPSGIEMIDVDPSIGCRATPDWSQVIQEAFIEGQEPSAFCSSSPDLLFVKGRESFGKVSELLERMPCYCKSETPKQFRLLDESPQRQVKDLPRHYAGCICNVQEEAQIQGYQRNDQRKILPVWLYERKWPL
jgi:membrane carboxypeptidase/penicillin-binding protein PbpC